MPDLLFTRRSAFALGAGAAALASFGAGPARAAAPMLGASQTVVRRFMLGGFEVTTINDGAIALDGPHPIFGENQPAEAVAALMTGNMLPPDRFAISFTVTLVNTGAELILFDAGNGVGRRPDAGLLLSRLSQAGVTADQIDVVVITHMHPDHIGGLMENGAPAFPNARYVTGSVEYDFFTSDAAPERIATLMTSNVKPLAEKMRFLKGGDAVASGIEAVEAFGHTPGHMAYHVESEGRRLLITADTANHFVASLQQPEWHVRFDMIKDKAIAARKAVFGMIAADRIPFIGYHMPAPAVGFVEPLGEGFRYVPESYQLSL